MADTELIREIVAEFFEVDREAVGPSFPLNGRRGLGSIARAALDSAIRRRAGVKAGAVYTAKTFQELTASLGGAAPGGEPAPAALEPLPSLAASAGPPGPAQAAVGRVACGVDLESVAALPESDDYWEHGFYRDHFTPGEIAYCCKQAEPRVHFAARWCAKEALRKCDPAFTGTPMTDVELASDGSGAPSLYLVAGGRRVRLPLAVSVSHTTEAAVAVVLAVGLAPGAALPAPALNPAVASVAVAPVGAAPDAGRPGAGRGAGPRLLHVIHAAATLAALGTAAVALWKVSQ